MGSRPRVRRWETATPSRADLEARMSDEGLTPSAWSYAPGDWYGWHSHDYHKVLYCARGGVVFHTREGDFDLGPGDRLDVPPGTEHAATVGPEGVECLEARLRMLRQAPRPK